jgi:hypothetical protein
MEKNNGCSYGKVTRQIVSDIKEDIMEIRKSVVNLSNHYSKRLPHWATVIITLLSSLSVGLIVGVAIKAIN